MIKSGLLRPNLFCLFVQNDRQTLGPHPGDVRADFEWRRSYYLPRNQFFLLPASLPASLEKWVKSILLPWKLTDERADTLGQVPDGVCRWFKSHRSSLKAFGPLGQALPPLPASPQKWFKMQSRPPNVENIDFFGSFMEPRHQGIIWDGPQVKIRKLITRVTSLQSRTLLWACSRALTGPRYPHLGFFPHCCAPHTVVFDQTTGSNIKRSSFQVIICPATSFSYYPHRLQKVIKGILRPWKLTDEHAHTSGQVSDGVFKLLSAQKPVFPITRIITRIT